MIRRTLTFAALSGAAVLASLTLIPAFAAERTVLVPAASTDAKTAAPQAVAVLAGGCFWGMEAVFSHLRGVQAVSSGYAGGAATDANYEAVSAERTRHAEAIRVVYDPRQISYATLLRVYFSVAHDPTQLNRQGPDSGRQYRTAIFPASPAQRKAAIAYIAQLGKAPVWKKPIVTKIEAYSFFPAETYHQNFMAKNPMHPYIVSWDKPKVANLKRLFPNIYRS